MRVEFLLRASLLGLAALAGVTAQAQTSYRCTICGFVSPSAEAMAAHVYQAHPSVSSVTVSGDGGTATYNRGTREWRGLIAPALAPFLDPDSQPGGSGGVDQSAEEIAGWPPAAYSGGKYFETVPWSWNFTENLIVVFLVKGVGKGDWEYVGGPNPRVRNPSLVNDSQSVSSGTEVQSPVVSKDQESAIKWRFRSVISVKYQLPNGILLKTINESQSWLIWGKAMKGFGIGL